MHIDRVRLRADQYPDTDQYPYDQPFLQGLGLIELSAPVCFFVGENGSGKSTVLEAIARRCGIHIWRNTDFPTLEANPYAASLQYYIDVDWSGEPVPGAFFSSSNYQHFIRTVDQWAREDQQVLDFYGGRSLVSQSHGQSIMSYFRSRYGRRGLYFMDEPETALSPGSQLDLVRLLRDMAQAGHAQFIIATHSPILLACPEAAIYTFDQIPAQPIVYEQTPLYRTYREFMMDPQGSIASAGAEAEEQQPCADLSAKSSPAAQGSDHDHR